MGFFGDLANIGFGILEASNRDVQQSYEKQLNKWQQNFAQQQLAYQQDWNQIQFDYQKAQNDLSREREDSAVQRRVADLKAAGLNPNLAAGQGAASGSYGASGGSSGASASTRASVPQLRAPNAKLELAQEVLDVKNRQEQLLQMQAQRRLLQSQQGYYDSLSGRNSADTEVLQARSSEILYNLNKSKALNLRTNDLSTGVVRQVIDALEYIRSPDAKGLLTQATEKTRETVDTVKQFLGDDVPSSGKFLDFIKWLTMSDQVKSFLKSVPDNIRDSAGVIKQLWWQFQDRLQISPKMLDSGIIP